jgi:hypothetical protein
MLDLMPKKGWRKKAALLFIGALSLFLYYAVRVWDSDFALLGLFLLLAILINTTWLRIIRDFRLLNNVRRKR